MAPPCTGAAAMAPDRSNGSGAGGASLQATGLKILYVEDDARAAAEIIELAESSGDSVVWESTGGGGLLRAGMDEFDVVILDRMLPDVDGLTILRRLRESGVGGKHRRQPSLAFRRCIHARSRLCVSGIGEQSVF